MASEWLKQLNEAKTDEGRAQVLREWNERTTAEMLAARTVEGVKAAQRRGQLGLIEELLARAEAQRRGGV